MQLDNCLQFLGCGTSDWERPRSFPVDPGSQADCQEIKTLTFIVCWRMLMSLKGQLLETNGRWSVKSTERTVAYVFPALLGLLLLVCLAPGALAQGLSGSNLRGVVKDSTGGLVPNASVKLHSTRS